jgi:hypothetical protein
MTAPRAGFPVASEIRSLAGPPDWTGRPRPAGSIEWSPTGSSVGEAPHGTHECYRWRAEQSRCLIEEHGVGWIGEGDWPDCWRINRWVRGQEDQVLDA